MQSPLHVDLVNDIVRLEALVKQLSEQRAESVIFVKGVEAYVADIQVRCDELGIGRESTLMQRVQALPGAVQPRKPCLLALVLELVEQLCACAFINVDLRCVIVKYCRRDYKRLEQRQAR